MMSFGGQHTDKPIVRDDGGDLASGVSVVVPVYNSENSLLPLVQSVLEVLKGLETPHEMILVNDGSSDSSKDVLASLSREHPELVPINLMRNFGQHNALLCGIRKARFDRTITMDDDLQHPADAIPKLLQALEEGYDVVYGSPEEERHGFLRDMASRTTKLVLQNAMGADTARHISAFRALRTHVRDAFATYDNSFVSIDVLLTWGTRRFTSIRVPHAERTIGASNYTLRRLIIHTFNMVTGFSSMPLQFASLVGFLVTILGVFMLIYVLVRYVVNGGSVPGFPFLASIIIIFSGAELFTLGIMGEYVARIHSGITRRPAYVVGRTPVKKSDKA